MSYIVTFVRNEVRGKVPSLHKIASKFILGVTRMYLDGQLNDEKTKDLLNRSLKYVASEEYIDKYDRDFNSLSAQDIIQQFEEQIKRDIEIEREEVSQMQFDSTSDYTIVSIKNFHQASQYSKYTVWCVTKEEYRFNEYTSNGMKQFYFCLKNGFENVPKEMGDGCPLDEYGLSMIAVCVDGYGELSTCTCRWNHDNGGDDNIMNVKQISEVMGQNFYNVFKPNNNWKEGLNKAMEQLRNGVRPSRVFDEC